MTWKSVAAISVGAFLGAVVVFGKDMIPQGPSEPASLDEADATPINIID